MSKTKFDRSSGFGLLGWVFLIVVLYAILSISIGVATNENGCGPGYERQWQYAPPRWVCK
jgi:hypothetical protein